MSECTSLNDYEAKYKRNATITGTGMSTSMHVPCPFCAERDFMIHRIVDTRLAYIAGAICDHCGRGCRALYKDTGHGGMSMEFVQTTGIDPPSFVPHMRRDPPPAATT
jgi:hypothetical protein